MRRGFVREKRGNMRNFYGSRRRGCEEMHYGALQIDGCGVGAL